MNLSHMVHTNHWTDKVIADNFYFRYILIVLPPWVSGDEASSFFSDQVLNYILS